MRAFNEEEVMFICGAEVTNDGDWQPYSFTVFPRTTEPEKAIEIISKKIMKQMDELDMDFATGSMEFLPIVTWENFAAIKIDDAIKMEALAGGIARTFMESLAGTTTGAVAKIAAMPWMPFSED